MKKNEKKTLFTKSAVELRKLEGDLSAEIALGRVKRYTEQNKNSRTLRALRNKRSVVKTALRQKELGETL